MAKLVVNPGSPVAWEIQLKPGANFIGRGFANDFKIPDPSVSGSHCQIVVSDQSVAIKDLGSTNGTFVNRAPVREAVLQNGQTLHLGGVEMLFYADGPAPAGAAQPARPTVRAVVPSPAAPSPPLGTPGTAPASVPIGTPAPLPTLVPIGTPAPIASPATPAASRPSAPPAETVFIAKPPPPAPRPPTVSIATPRPVAAPPPILEPPPVLAPHPVAATTAPALAAGPHPCKHHSKTPGRLFCNQCQHYFCELCVTVRAAGGASQKFCRHCGAECVPVQVRLQRPVQVGFFARLPGAFAYPVRGAGVVLVVVGIVISLMIKFGSILVLVGSLRFKIFGMILVVCATGYLFTYLQSILHSTAAEDREMPDLAGISFAEDVFVPFLRFLGLAIFCFGPAIVVGVAGAPAPAIFATAIFGALYFPMAFLAVAILDSVGAGNPLVVVPSIVKVPLEYLATLILLGAVLALRPLGDFLIGKVFPEGFLTHSMGVLVAMVAVLAFWAFLSFYLLIVAVHILGLLYVAKKDKLGWLDR